MDRTLIILVTNYPYGFGEHFMENELFALADEFSHIYIVATDQKYLGSKIKISRIPDNVQLIEYVEQINKKDKVLALRHLFSTVFLQDIAALKKCNVSICKIFLMEYLKAQKLSHFLDSLIKRQQIKTSTCYVYSYWNDFMSASIAQLKIIYPEIKGFSRAHRWDLYFEENPFNYLPLRRFIYSKIDAVFLIAQDGIRYLLNKFEEYSNKYIFSPLGTVEHNNRNCIYNNEFTIVSCSAIIPVKNINIIIEALTIIDKHIINWIHFGNGYLDKEMFLLANEKLKDKKNIKFEFKGFVENIEIFNYYLKNQINLLLNVSLSEGIPVSMMEAMSFGIPVIGTNVGGVSEIIEHEKNGLLLSPTPSKEEVAAVIERFCSLSLDEVQTMRANAYSTWNTKFNAQKNYKAFIEQICNL